MVRTSAPIAARILVNPPSKGNIQVVLRHWIFDNHNHVEAVDYTSLATSQNTSQLELELNSRLDPLKWGSSNSFVSIEKAHLLDVNF